MIAAWLAACGGPDGTGPDGTVPPTPTEAPAADAGPDVWAQVGDEVVLDAGGSVGATFRWTLDDGRVLDGARVTVTFDAPGHRSVVLSAVADDGRTATDDAAITITWPVLPDAPASARAMALGADRAWVPMPDFDSLAVIERGTGAVAHVGTCRTPRTVSAAAGRVWVACAGDAVAVHAEDGALERTIALPRGSRPWGVVADGDGAWVTLTGSGALARVTAAGRVTVTGGFPDARGLARVGADVFVSRWRSPDDGGVVFRADRDGAPAEAWHLGIDPGPDSDTNTRGVPSLLSPVVVRPDGRVLAVGGLKSNVARGLYLEGVPFTHDTTTRADLRSLALDPGEGEVGTELPAVVFDDRDQVIDLAFSPAGDRLYALHLGMEVVDVYDAYTRRRAGTASPVGHGPDAVVVDGAELWVSAPLSRTVTVFDLANPALPAPARVLDLLPRGGEVLPADVLAGKVVFTSTADLRMSAGGYAACATCHPEGHADGRTWDFTQRGEGLRNTTSLLGGAGVAPLHWTANFDEVQDFENDIRANMGGLGFLSDDDFAATQDTLGAPKAGLSPELDALAAYLGSLAEAPPSPYRAADGGLSPEAERGAAWFLDPTVGCAGCHPAPTYTDSTFLAPADPLLHDVGTLGPGSGQRRGGPLTGLDTPSLRGVWATAPYLHDGSAPDLHAVLVERNPDDAHGVTSGLTEVQVAELIAFLSSIE